MPDYDVITVDAGDTFTKSLDDGEVFENVLIDITAEGASYSIHGTGASGWEIRNIGVRGTFDTHSNDSEFEVLVPNSGGTGVIEHVYLPGASTPGHGYDGPTGIYVHRQHAGDVLVREANIKRMQDNGIYASSPGHDASDAEGGSTRVENSLFEGNATSGIRLGTSESYAENCVMKDGVHRGFWCYYENPELVDCDVFGNATADIFVGGKNYDKQANAVVEAVDSRWETESLILSGNEINGSSAGEPQDRVPAGVPLSPEEAAAGESSAGGSGGSGNEPAPLLVEIIADEGNTVEYTFTAGGEIVPTETAELVGSVDEPNVSINQADGEWTAEGLTGNGWGDAFEVYGNILSFSATNEGYTLYVDGQEVTPEEATQIEYDPGLVTAGINPLYAVAGLGAAYFGYKRYLSE